MISGLPSKAVGSVVTGLMGAVAYDGIKKVAATGVLREGAVTAATWGLRGRRHLEAGAEQLRLATGDILAEARARTGEQAPPPGAAEQHEHAH